MPAERPRDEDFRAYVERGDVEALARFFDAAAPRLLLVAAHVAPAGVEAEDLVQQTFLEALRGNFEPRADATALSWLASILRRRAIDEHRRAHRSREKSLEPQHDRPGSEPDPVERLADDEAFELVVAAIDALEPPQREVVSLRLVHGLDPATIAHTLGRQPGTVRMQLKRGLERLRGALPAGIATAVFAAFMTDHGLAQVREAVLAEARRPPLPLAPSGAGSNWALTSILLHPVSIMLALVAVLSIASLALPTSNDPSASLSRMELPALGTSAPLTVESSSSARVPLDAVNSTLLASAAEGDGEKDDSSNGPRLSGRLVDPDGLPVGGATIAVQVSTKSGPFSKPDRVKLDPVTTSDDGTFSFATGLESEHSIWIDINASGQATLFLDADLTGTEGDWTIGDVRLPRTGTIRGRVVLPDGQPIPWGESLYASGLTKEWEACDALDSAQVRPTNGASTTGAEHWFTLDGVPEGHQTLRVKGALWSTDVSDVPVHAGEVTEIEVVWLGTDPSTTLVVDIRGSNAFPATPSSERTSVRLELQNGASREPDSYPMAGATFLDVPEGLHRLVVDDPCFLPAEFWVAPGPKRARVELTGGASVRLRVFDAQGERVTDYSVGASVHNVYGNEYEDLRELASEHSDHELVAGVPCADQQWTVVLPSGDKRSVSLTGLTRSEIRDITIKLDAQFTLTGVVRDENGDPRAYVHVEARPRGSTNMPRNIFSRVPAQRYASAKQRTRLLDEPLPVVTDAEGHFEIRVGNTEAHVLLVHDSPWNYEFLELAVPGESLEATLPRSESLILEVPSVDGLDPSDLRWNLRCNGRESLRITPPSGPWREAFADGRVVFHGIPVGTREVLVSYSRGIQDRNLGLSEHALVLAATEVVAGSASHMAIDLTPVRPARLKVTASIHGTPDTSLVVRGTLLPSDLSSKQINVVLPLSADGIAEFDWLVPGLWTFAIAPRPSAMGTMIAPIWSVPIGEHVAQAGESFEVAPQVSFSSATITLVGPDGAPLPDRDLQFSQSGTTRGLRSDQDARVKLTLPPGSYFLQLHRAGPGRRFGSMGPTATLEWTVDGPLHETLTLEPPATD